jgi:uncharacterized membrane protein
MIILLLFYLLVPAAVIWLCRSVKFLSQIGPILILYIVGIIAGNLPLMPDNAYQLQDILTSAIIPIAIPMLLFSSNFRRFSAKKSFIALICGVVAVVVTVVAGYLIFKPYLGPEGYKIGGMLTGVYIGGTANMAAIKLMLGVKSETYILLNSYDMIVSFVYMIFLMGIGIKLARKILPGNGRAKAKKAIDDSVADEATNSVHMEKDSYNGIFKWKNLRQVLLGFSLSIVIMLISFGITGLAVGGFSQGLGAIMSNEYFMVIIILSLTTLAILASFVKPVGKLEKSYDGGMYLIYIFSVTVASMADISNLDFSGGIYMFLYVVFAIFFSLILQTLLSKLFRVEGDTMVITSVAIINSAPFVPMMSAIMKNKDTLIIGLSAGIIGYAIGSYLGVAVAGVLDIM